MKIIVQKFGGSSLGSIQRIRDAAAIVQRSVEEGFSVVVVASAMGNSTDDLLLLSSSFDAKQNAAISSPMSTASTHAIHERATDR